MSKRITVRYFAGFREHAGVNEETLDLDAEEAEGRRVEHVRLGRSAGALTADDEEPARVEPGDLGQELEDQPASHAAPNPWGRRNRSRISSTAGSPEEVTVEPGLSSL